MEYTPQELMIVCTARQVQDGERVFVDMRLPLLAFALAKRTHAPHCVDLFETDTMWRVRSFRQDKRQQRQAHADKDPLAILYLSHNTDYHQFLGSVFHLALPPLVPIIDRRGVAMLFDAQTLHPLFAQLLHILCPC